MKLFLLFLCIQNFIHFIASSKRPIVTIADGKLEGIYNKTINHQVYSAFLNVPFAAPPVSENRFKEPLPVIPWQGTKDAGIPAPPCLQMGISNMSTIGSEDCLYLNVYTPKIDYSNRSRKTSLLPVIVHIHGGAFMSLNSRGHGPAYLLHASDVILVTITYRVGPLGFLSTGDAIVPGNNGLKDQVQALKWVQNNIEAFGGNKNSVTISGLSAGGASVHYMYLSPTANGLFHRGFANSGSTFCHWTIGKALPEKTKVFASILNCTTENSQTMVDCLKSRDGSEIVKLSAMYQKLQNNPFTVWGPTVEVKNEKAFLDEEPYALIKAGKFKNLTLIFSSAAQEGLYTAAGFIENKTLLSQVNNDWDTIAPHLLDFNFTVDRTLHNVVGKIIRKYYFGDKEISSNTVDIMVELCGDRFFTADIARAAMLQASISSAPIYYYRFGYRGRHSLSEYFTHTSTNFGVSHADDTAYFFNAPYLDSQQTSSDREMSRKLVSMLIKFAKTGTPSFGNRAWKPVSKTAQSTGILNFLDIYSPGEYRMNYSSNFGNMRFWQSLPISESGNGRFL